VQQLQVMPNHPASTRQTQLKKQPTFERSLRRNIFSAEERSDGAGQVRARSLSVEIGTLLLNVAYGSTVLVVLLLLLLCSQRSSVCCS
jgi:hypothetical protein